jgi:hypothetical protein
MSGKHRHKPQKPMPPEVDLLNRAFELIKRGDFTEPMPAIRKVLDEEYNQHGGPAFRERYGQSVNAVTHRLYKRLTQAARLVSQSEMPQSGHFRISELVVFGRSRIRQRTTFFDSPMTRWFIEKKSTEVLK